VYLRESKTLADAWWGRYLETVETEAAIYYGFSGTCGLATRGNIQSLWREGHCVSTWTGGMTINRWP
jgi:hypothetical protein